MRGLWARRALPTARWLKVVGRPLNSCWHKYTICTPASSVAEQLKPHHACSNSSELHSATAAAALAHSQKALTVPCAHQGLLGRGMLRQHAQPLRISLAKSSRAAAAPRRRSSSSGGGGTRISSCLCARLREAAVVHRGRSGSMCACGAVHCGELGGDRSRMPRPLVAAARAVTRAPAGGSRAAAAAACAPCHRCCFATGQALKACRGRPCPQQRRHCAGGRRARAPMQCSVCTVNCRRGSRRALAASASETACRCCHT